MRLALVRRSLETNVRRSPGGGLLLHGLPAVETIPAELVGSTNLIGETERIDPSLLLGPPTAVPRELEHARFACAFDDNGSHEIRAARTRIDVKSLDDPFGMGVEDLVHQADHLDPRHGAGVRDRRRLSARRQGDDVRLETFGGGRSRQQLGIDWHGRNISKRWLVPEGKMLSLKTKLTVGSAHARAT